MSLLAAINEAPELQRPINLFQQKPIEPLVTVESRRILILGSDGLAGNVVQEGMVTGDYQAIVSENNELITIVTKSYKLVQDEYINAAIVRLIEGTVDSDNPLMLLKRTHPTRWSTEWAIVESKPAFNIATTDNQGVFFTMQITNSYDKSASLKLGCGFSIIHCGNYFNYGYRSTNEKDLNLKHTSGKDLEGEIIQALLKGSEVRQTAVEIARKGLDREWLLSRNAAEDYDTVRQPLVEYGVEVHQTKFANIIKRDIPLYGDGSFNVFMSATEMATYYDHYQIPLSLAKQLQKAVSRTFFPN